MLTANMQIWTMHMIFILDNALDKVIASAVLLFLLDVVKMLGNICAD